MAWLQNLAGRAEDLLNKIDQNAATVLNESNSKLSDIDEQGSPTQILPGGINYNNGNGSASALNLTRSSSCLNLSNQEYIADSCDSFTDTVADVNVMPENSKISGKSDEDNVDISTKSSVQSDKHSSSNSSQDSFIQEIDSVLLEAKIAKLELENQDNSKQILNMQHLYAELRNENANLQFQIDRANKQVAEAQIEKDQYIARAHRILLEKEKLISLKQENNSIEEAQNIFATYNEELKKELEFHQRRNEELVNKNKQLAKEIQSLQKNHQVILNGFQLTNEKLEQKLANEMRFRSTAEEDCLQTNKELFVRNQENLQLRELLRARDDEILSLKETIKQKTNAATNEGVESTIKSLTETLMLKQNNLETVTTERNALRLQLEKLETDYRNNLIQMNRSQTRAVHMEEPDESVPLPRFMRVSPFDAGVTRRVKHAYSTLDAVSIRTGVFLRRYPVARVFVFCYMVLLHIWVFILLFQYVPQTSH